MTEREPWVTGDRNRTDVRRIPTPPLHLPCHLDVPPAISSLAQPASPTTDHHWAQGKGPPPSVLSQRGPCGHQVPRLTLV